MDIEQVTQSATWTLAREPQMRSLLLLLWITAWQQIPCGSLPDDDELLAAMVGMDPEEFRARRRVLMRGWWLADDGRLYHDTIASRVRDMLDAKLKERQRKAEYRAKKELERGVSPPDVPRDKRGTDSGHPRDSTVGDATGTGTGTGTGLREDSGTASAHRAGARDRPGAVEGTTAGDVCAALHRAGLARVNPAHPRLLALIESGATRDEFMGFVDRCKGKSDPFAYLLAAVEGERVAAAAMPPGAAINGHHGHASVSRQDALEATNRSVGQRWLARRRQGETT